MSRIPHAIALILLLAGCQRGVTPGGGAIEATLETQGAAGGRAPADGTALPLPTDAWVGRWTGPEGLFVDIAQGGERGRYAVTIKGDLDSAGDRVTGMAEGRSIRFVRAGTPETLRAGDGEATGLKRLAGKRDCLVVKPGEGFCRD